MSIFLLINRAKETRFFLSTRIFLGGLICPCKIIISVSLFFNPFDVIRIDTISNDSWRRNILPPKLLGDRFRYLAGDIIFSVEIPHCKWRKTNVDPYEKHWIWNSAQKLPNQYHRLSKSSRESFARITQFPSNVHRKLNRSTVSKCFENRHFLFEKRSSKEKKPLLRFKMTTIKKKNVRRKIIEKKSHSREKRKKKGIKGEPCLHLRSPQTNPFVAPFPPLFRGAINNARAAGACKIEAR